MTTLLIASLRLIGDQSLRTYLNAALLFRHLILCETVSGQSQAGMFTFVGMNRTDSFPLARVTRPRVGGSQAQAVVRVFLAALADQGWMLAIRLLTMFIEI